MGDFIFGICAKIYWEVFVLKKVLLTTLISFGLLLGFGNLDAEASVDTRNDSENDGIGVRQATRATLSPADLSGRTNTYYSLTVYSNVGGSVSFTFDPGIAGQQARRENGSGSRRFSQEWTTNSLKVFTTSARVISPAYGPSPWVYGKATIRY